MKTDAGDTRPGTIGPGVEQAAPNLHSFSGAGLRPRRHIAPAIRRLLGPILVLALWWAAAIAGHGRRLPAPDAVLATGTDLVRSGQLPDAIAASLQRVATGVALGVSAGLVLALLSGLFRIAEDLIDAPVHILRALPALALVPLAILWFGIGELPKVLLIAWATCFPVYLNTFAGIRSVDRSYDELARSLQLGRWTVVRRIVVPGSLPGFLVGLRYSLTLGWLVLVVSEQINASSGLGQLMTEARQFFRTDVMFVCLDSYGLLGWLSDRFVRTLERHLLAWRREYQNR
ncbi:sulfonate transport system permease protein [Kribbella pratensis]|uniref:Sulfonate transport system permease protein n=1 Tax=Kribbella pratensis TaxID=2512112 RepID=A0ABY2FKY8_9ACTN|nr:ABC transporter permease [Kribbella pratensis]TDW93449.1 sulfonate transport system permease protein [Kribbella pratensis]